MRSLDKEQQVVSHNLCRPAPLQPPQQPLLTKDIQLLQMTRVSQVPHLRQHKLVHLLRLHRTLHQRLEQAQRLLRLYPRGGSRTSMPNLGSTTTSTFQRNLRNGSFQRVPPR